MKKGIVFVVVFTLLSAALWAQFSGPSGGGSVTTIAEFKADTDLGNQGGLFSMAIAAEKADERDYILEGHLISHVRRNIYEFQDDTGTVYVYIRDFGGVQVTPDDLIRLYGEAEYDDGYLYLVVEQITKQ